MKPYWEQDGNKIYHGNALDVLRSMDSESVQMCVTSPPYWGLRDYDLPPMIWDAQEGCVHEWGDESGLRRSGRDDDFYNGKSYSLGQSKRERPQQGQFCIHCGAWFGSLGLEPTPELYLKHMVEIFRELRRVLRNDGTLWLNIAGSYSSLTIFSQFYRLREDLTDKEKRYATMEMFKMRGRRPDKKGKGNVREVLPELVSEKTSQRRSGVEGKGVSEVVLQQPGADHGSNDQKKARVEVGSDSEAREQVRLLRGNQARISNDRPHRGNRSRASEKTLREKPSGFGQNILGHTETGLPEGQISSALLELQLFDRLLGILSTHRFKENEIPCSIRTYFIREVSHKPKDFVNIPHMLSESLRADGWYLRSAMPWVKRSAMPESTKDRPASALEYMFLLTKSSRYYFDMDAIRRAKADPLDDIGRWGKNTNYSHKETSDPMVNTASEWELNPENEGRGRNFRNTDLFFESLKEPYGMIFCGDEMVGIDCNPQAMKEAHFATFPEKLIEPCILAGTSEKGCCVECGAPWERVVEKKDPGTRKVKSDYPDNHTLATQKYKHGVPGPESKTTGWKPSCECLSDDPLDGIDGPRAPFDTKPCTVLDIFGGAMTTAIVAHKHGRKFIMIELSKPYIDEIGTPRIEKETKQMRLFN